MSLRWHQLAAIGVAVLMLPGLGIINATDMKRQRVMRGCQQRCAVKLQSQLPSRP